MKHKPIFAITGLLAISSLSLVVTSAHAQGGRRGNRGNQNNRNTQGGFQGGPGGPGGLNVMQMMTGGANIIDPAQTAKATLVYRPEVQNALALDLKQKNALDALKAAQAQNQQKMTQDFRVLMQSMRSQQNQNQAQNPTQGQNQPQTPVDRQQLQQDVAEKAKGIVQGYQDEQLKQIDEILTLRQRKRLTEIDLRWRGPMSLVDPKVAEQAQIGDDDKKKAQAAYKEFTDARQKLIESMLPAGARNRFIAASTAANGATPGGSLAGGTPPAPPTPTTAPLTPQEQQAAQKKALVDFEKSRVAMGTKLVANVTPAAATTWGAMIGAPITFRNNDL